MVKVEAKQGEVKLTVDGVGPGNWEIYFVRNHGTCTNQRFHAELEAQAITEALRADRRKLAREVLESLRRRNLPGSHRGKLSKAIDSVSSIYGL